MRSMNRITLVGHVGADPDVRDVSGTKVAHISVATTRKWKDTKGKEQEKTEWHRVILWDRKDADNGLASITEEYVSTGAPVLIEGEMQYRKYENDEGEERWIAEVRAHSLILLGKKSDKPTKARRDREEDDQDNDPDWVKERSAKKGSKTSSKTKTRR